MLTRILVTGADGFVGRWALRALTARYPDAMLVAGVRDDVAASCAHEHLAFDITDQAETLSAIRRCSPDGVLHLAGLAAVGDAEDDPERAIAVNLHGTLNLARAVLEAAAAARFIHVSSAEVYGASLQTSATPLAEDALLAPLNIYALSKAAGDLAIGMMAARGLKAIRMRPFNHIGPGQDDRFVVSAFARQIAEIETGRKAPVMKVGSLTAQREFIDVRDVVDAYARTFALAEEQWSGTVVNLAGGQLTAIGDLITMLRRHARVSFAVEQDAALVRPEAPGYAGGDPTRAAALIAWRPQTPLDQTLADSLEYWRGRIG